jgi:hypothetical protein
MIRTPVDYTSKARELLGAGKSPAAQLWVLVNDTSVDWADDIQNWKKPTSSPDSANSFIC